MIEMDSNMTDMPPMPNMATSFFFGLQRPLLFSTWNLNNAGELVGAIIVMLILAILYEGLKTLRDALITLEKKMTRSGRDDEMKQLLPGADSSIKDQCLYLLRQYINIFHIIQSLLHVVQVGYGYILMLVAMTYNGWLFLAVCFGAGLGYFIFARCKSSSEREQNEHCN